MTGTTGTGVTRRATSAPGTREEILRNLQWEPGASSWTEAAGATAESLDADAEARIAIRVTEDIVKARQAGRLLAKELGFSDSRTTLLTTAISELARNILLYAGQGDIVLSRQKTGEQAVVSVKAVDQGPGIADIPGAMAGGFSTSGGLGLGLSGLRQIMETFEIESRPGKGTQVIVRLSAE